MKEKAGGRGSFLKPAALLALSIPMIMLVAPLLGYFLGKLVDRFVGGEPYGHIIGLLLGILAGVRETVLIIKRINKIDT